MKILVIDVAAEHSGALSILNQFRREFECDTENKYTVLLGKLTFSDTNNIQYLSYPWIKKSRIHRLFFDYFCIPFLIRKNAPDRVLSLQNNAAFTSVPQEVYFHNALFICEKRYKFTEAKNLWVYQNIISQFTQRSLKRADRILVQAGWIKKGLNSRWGIPLDRIVVKRPLLNEEFWGDVARESGITKILFYPANKSSYKNHRAMLSALASIWDEDGVQNGPKLILTGESKSMPQDLQDLILSNNYPVSFVGKLDMQQMKEMYGKTDMIFPSYIETVGLPLMEAKATGSFILAADCEYAHESVGEYDRILYFDPFRVDSIKAAIRSYLKF